MSGDLFHLHFSFLLLQLWAERSRQQIQGTDIWTYSWSGHFFTGARSYISFSSKTLMLLVSHFTSSGQQAKLTVLGSMPSLPFIHVYLLHSSRLQYSIYIFLSLCYFSYILPLMNSDILTFLLSPHPSCICFPPHFSKHSLQCLHAIMSWHKTQRGILDFLFITRVTLMMWLWHRRIHHHTSLMSLLKLYLTAFTASD